MVQVAEFQSPGGIIASISSESQLEEFLTLEAFLVCL